MNKTRVAVYCRVSTDYDDQINSLNSQKSYFEEYINRIPDWELVDIFADEGLSGTSTKKRKEFLRMISMAKNKKIDLIITKEVSRFARNTVDTLTFTRELKSLGVGVLFINDNINTLDNDGELRLTIMSSIAQEESRKTSERVKWGQKRRMEQGVVFGNGLYGYTLKDGKLNINKKEAEIIVRIFSAFVFEKKGGYTIAKELNLENIKPMHALEWSSNSILKIIRNEKYCGDLLQKKTCTPDFLSHRRIENNECEDKLLIKNHHEKIISRELWEQAQAELKRRTGKTTGQSRHSARYWCSGKVFCGECGSRFVSKTSKSKSGYIYKGWRCFNAVKNGKQIITQNGDIIGCDNKAISDTFLSECVWEIFLYHIKDMDILPEIKKDIKQLDFIITNTNAETNDKRLRKLKKKCEVALENLMDNTITKEDYIFLKNKYTSEINTLRAEMNSTENTEKNDSKKEKLEEYLASVNSNFTNRIINKHVLGEITERITIYADKRIEIKLKYSEDIFSFTYNMTKPLISFKVYKI